MRENRNYLILLLLIVIVFNVKLPYYVDAPGGVIDISDRIEYEDKFFYEGSLNMLYVTEYVATIPTYIMSYILKDWDLVSIEDSRLADESTEDIDVRNKIMLDNSVNNAMYVAYETAGKEIIVSSKRHLVIGNVTDTNLMIGDEIREVNGKQIISLKDIKDLIAVSNIGDSLVFEVIRDGKEKVVKESIKDIDGDKALGVVLITDLDYETNPEIELNFRDSESGSSGGMMLALSIYSAISGEDILKGRNIAGTGTIDLEGNIGEISGIKYKIIGAAKKGIDVVLVPSANYDEAIKVKKEYGYKFPIVKVDTFEEAVEYLSK